MSKHQEKSEHLHALKKIPTHWALWAELAYSIDVTAKGFEGTVSPNLEFCTHPSFPHEIVQPYKSLWD